MSGVQLRLPWKTKKVAGIIIADVLHDLPQPRQIIRKLAIVNLYSNHAAENATKVLMPREGQEASGVGEHANKVA